MKIPPASFLALLFALFLNPQISDAQSGPQSTPLYYPFAEWQVSHSDYSGNPYDIVATVTFTHGGSGEQRTTEMFYDGDWDWQSQSKGGTDLFKWRFSGTRLGQWSYQTNSSEPALDGLTGSIDVTNQSNQQLARGFLGKGADVGQDGRKWVWSNGQAILPRLAMRGSGGFQNYRDNTGAIDADIQEFVVETGLTGLHVEIFWNWFDADNPDGTQGNQPDRDNPELAPDPETLEVMESIIRKVYEAGGHIHIWTWGKRTSGGTFIEDVSENDELAGGINGPVHKRLQRYIAARLGPLPGWSMGAGFDVWDGWEPSELESWHGYYKSKLGWDHIIGARVHDRNNQDPTNPANIMTDQLDYMGHEDFKINFSDLPDENGYTRWRDLWFASYPDMVHMSEDRFRQNYDTGTPGRSFNTERSRESLWEAAMVGGLFTIWGDMNGDGDSFSHEFENKGMFKAFSDFWEDRYSNDMIRDNSLGNDKVLRKTDNSLLIFYVEDNNAVQMDLSGLNVERAVAFDTRTTPYAEINITGQINGNTNTSWAAPNSSSWVVAVETGPGNSGSPPSGAPAINSIDISETTADVTYSGVNNADSYQYRLGGGSAVGIGTANPFTVEDLNPGIDYSLEMRALNSDGSGPWSAPANFTTQQQSDPPDQAPVIDEITTTTNSADVTYAGISNANSYQYRLDGGSAVGVGTTNPFTVDELDPGTDYSLEMRALNSDGAGPWSQPQNFTTQQQSDPPDQAPVIDEITTTTNSADVTYAGISNADSYQYRLDGGSAVGVGTTNPFTVDDLQPGTDYAIELRAVNSDGAGPWSQPQNFTTQQQSDPPDQAPVINEITTTTNTADVAYSGVSEADSYQYRLDGGSAVGLGTTNPFTVDDLQPGTDYAIELRAVNDDGSGPWSQPQSFTTNSAGNPPSDTPTIREINTTTTTAEVAYSGANGATEYQYRLGGGEAVAIGSTNPFTIEELDPGTEYAIEMRGLNDDGAGNWSQPQSFTTEQGSQPPAQAPTIDNITATTNSAEVSYSGVSEADSYQYRLDGGSAVGVGTTNPFTVDELDPGTDYSLEMRALNSDGAGPWSQPQNFTTQQQSDPPDQAPVIDEITTTTNSADVTYAGISNANSYQYRLDGGSAVGVGTTNPFTVDDLQPGTDYAIELRAVNSDGAGPWSQPQNFTTQQQSDPPDQAPVINEITTTTNTADVAYSGVSEADSYQYRLDGGSAVGLGTTNPFTVDDLQPGTDYAIELRAVNDDGSGPWSQPQSFTTNSAGNPPSDTPTIREINTTTTTAEVAYSGANGATEYQYRLGGGEAVAIGSTNPFTIEELDPGTEYAIEMRGLNDDGAGNWSQPQSFTTEQGSQPPAQAPTIDNITATTNSAEVSYSGVSEADSYQYRLDGGSAVGVGTTNPFTVDDLQPGTDYAIEMRAVNDDGSGPWSQPQSFTTNSAGNPPSDTPTIREINTTTTTAEVAYSGANGATEYQYRLGGGEAVAIGSTNPFTIEELDPGTEYAIEMRGLNDDGAGNWSQPQSFTTEQGSQPPAQAPTIDNITATTNSAEVSYSGVSEADSYQYRLDGGSAVGVGTTNPFTVDDLQPDTDYAIEMRAVNDDGTGPWSDKTNFSTQETDAQSGPQSTPLYYPFAEWQVSHSDYSGNPYDIVATVTFTHGGSGEQRTTEMFYDGDWDWQSQSKGGTDLFKWRFSGTRLGQWSYQTNSSEPALDGLTGSIDVTNQSNQQLARGFLGKGADVGQDGRKWVWSNGQAILPRLAMRGSGGFQNYRDNTGAIDADIQEFVVETGLTGLHVEIFWNWFDADNPDGTQGNQPDRDNPELAPDPETLEVMESIIRKVYEAGGHIHIWTWGKRTSGGTFIEDVSENDELAGGINGPVHKRLQRYIAARLGPLPGWSMGAGFNVWDGWEPSELESWHGYYKSKLGWDHIIGARVHDRNNQDPTNPANIMTDQLDYMGHEDFKINFSDLPDENGYTRWRDLWFASYPDMVHMSEDRFRQNYDTGTPGRSFNTERSRESLWEAAMVGGLFTIWGDMNGDGDSFSHEFENKGMFKAFSDFWEDRYSNDMIRDNSLGNDKVLRKTDNSLLIFYVEDNNAVQMDLSGLNVERAVAFDTRTTPYAEINITGQINGNTNTSWTAPNSSSWVVAVKSSSISTGAPPANPPTINTITSDETSIEVRYSRVVDAERYQYRLNNGSTIDIGTTNPFTIEDLNPGTEYSLEMRSVNIDGDSSWSDTQFITTKNIEEGIPNKLMLMQNYPNPFTASSSTTIEFGVPETMHVTVEIYDMLGRRVATLFNEVCPPGYHDVPFNAGNLSTGIYMYMVKTDKSMEMKKMIMVK